ncbi:hypothetical protein LBMAG27_12300 [Bacteroidota bacterium]|nr:hypothetical protein LBMAG27_12300 [Bacteroidota bacterium]
MSGNQMDTTCSSIVNENIIDINWQTNIQNLFGIQYFDNLDSLTADGLNNAVVPALPQNLTFLELANDGLNNLPSLCSSIKTFRCATNNLTSLPSLPDSLILLYCDHNQLATIPNFPDSLHVIYCPFNLITSLPNVPSVVKKFYCHNNQLTNLPFLSNSIKYMFCQSNQLTNLPQLPNSLSELGCSYNQLTSIPPLPPHLGYLNCANNNITELPPFNDTMSMVCVMNNPQLMCLPSFEFLFGSTLNFYITGTGINCLPNLIQHVGSNLAVDTVPICNFFNSNNCNVAWNMKGSVFSDFDNDCITANDGSGIYNSKLKLFDSTFNLIEQVSSNALGEFSFDEPLGNYFTSVDTLDFPFDIVCPNNDTFQTSLTPVDSMDYGINFRFICKPGYDNGVWNVVRNSILFPQDTTAMWIIAGDIVQSIYNVSCSSGISGQVKIVINGPANYVSPLAGALTPTVNGDTLTYSIADFSLVNAATDFAFNVLTDSTAQIGDAICFDVSVTPTTGDNNILNNALTHCFSVSNSFDPNEKEVSPIGDLNYPFNNWLTYTIHFQNTGTAPAQHIQILDTLDSDLDESTFQLLSSSFDPMVQLFGNKVRFNFVNINLPDSGSNTEGSKGYVSYRIKPKQNLAIGTQIENTASIYFDFNSPVVTNTTLNTIVITGVNELAVGNLQLAVYPNPFSSQLTVGSMQFSGATLTVTDIFGREVLSVKPNLNSQIINLKSFPSGIYFLKVLLEDGNFAVKKIVKE